MNLDDLMAVWRSQDASPFHGVNETLLRLALRHDEARLKALRRKDDWSLYFVSALITAFMVFFGVMMFGMLLYNDDDVITSWDFVVPVVGAVAVLVMNVALYKTRRAQALREQRFGDSLRDQVGRSIAQLDDEATRGSRLTDVYLVATFAGGAAMMIAATRVNLEPGESFGGWAIVRIVLGFAIIATGSIWKHRRSVQRDVLPRKHRLEALMKELDVP